MPVTSSPSSGNWTRRASRASSWRPSRGRALGSRSWTGCAGRPRLDSCASHHRLYCDRAEGRTYPVPKRGETPKGEHSMKRSLALACLFALALAPVLMVADAWARVPSGSPSGGRGSRSYSSPASPSRPTQPSTPASPVQPAQPQRPGWGGALMGGLAGLALGGLLGSMFFGHGGGIGLGLMEILLIAGGAYLIYRMMRSRQATPTPATGY